MSDVDRRDLPAHAEAMGMGARIWLVEAKVSLRHPSRVSEESRCAFVEAMRSAEGDGVRAAEVGWTGDGTAFVAATWRARTARDAAEHIEATIRTRATPGARWRLTAGLQVDVLQVTPLANRPRSEGRT